MNHQASDLRAAPRVASTGRFAHIDALRAVAVMLVVIAHAGLGWIVPGGSGVTIFFCISGFVITSVLLRELRRDGGFRPSRFYLKRALKLAPPFLIAVIIPTLIYSVWNEVNWAQVLGQTFFFFNWQYMNGNVDVLPGSGVVWSLSVEEQFYIGFSAVWLLLCRSRYALEMLLVLSVGCIIAASALRIYLALTAFNHARTYYGTDTRLDGIAFGILGAVVVAESSSSLWAERVRRLASRDWMLVLAIATYIVSLMLRNEFFRETFRYSLQAFAALIVIVYGMTVRETRLHRLFAYVTTLRAVQLIGAASYSIYLVHLTVIVSLVPFFGDMPAVLSFGVLIILATAAGFLLWRLVEVPVLRVREARITN